LESDVAVSDYNPLFISLSRVDGNPGIRVTPKPRGYIHFLEIKNNTGQVFTWDDEPGPDDATPYSVYTGRYIKCRERKQRKTGHTGKKGL
jgi:hypothetical protein